jgi:hypothetical protein
MGQKTNPIGNRLGIIRGWESNWYGGHDYAEKVIQDEKIRIYLQARIEKGGIAHMVIERTLKRVTVSLSVREARKLTASVKSSRSSPRWKCRSTSWRSANLNWMPIS